MTRSALCHSALHRLGPGVSGDVRRHHPIVHFGVHPGKLHARLAGVEQAVGGVDVDLVACAAHVPVGDISQHREQVTQQRVVAGGGMVSADGLEIPQRRVDRVVLRGLALVGEATRQPTLRDIVR